MLTSISTNPKFSRYHYSFLSAFILGIFSYAYLMFNNLNNYDNIVCTPHGYGVGLTSGRWLLSLLADTFNIIWGNYNIPVFNCLLAILIIAVCSCFFVYIFDITNTFLCVCVSAIFISFPAIASAMIFSFTVHYYAIAIFFAILGIFFITKRPHSIHYFLLSSLLFACSLGIYQAYYPFIASLCILFLIHQTLQTNTNWFYILCTSFYNLFSLVSGYILYYIILRLCLFLFHTTLSDYKGINNLGHINFNDLPNTIIQTYYNYFLLPTHDYLSVSGTGILRFSILIIFILIFWSIFSQKKFFSNISALKKIELGAFLILLPIASNAITIMVSSDMVYTIMALGLISIFFLPIIIINNLFCRTNKHSHIYHILCTILLIVSINYSWQSNGNYRALYYADRQSENYYSTLFSRITSTAGYTQNMNILFVGHNINTSLSNPWQSTPFKYGGNSMPLNTYEMSRQKYIENYLGYYYYELSEDDYLLYSDSISEMSIYPDDGSIRIIDENTILVRFE